MIGNGRLADYRVGPAVPVHDSSLTVEVKRCKIPADEPVMQRKPSRES